MPSEGACRIAIGLLLALTATAVAEGEHGPMLGGALVAAQGPDEAEVAGLQGELAFWYGPVGVALEGSHQWTAASAGPRVAALGASARVLLVRALIPSLIEPRDVELGVELHGIAERSWWANLDDPLPRSAPFSYGAGLAVRLRGGSDDLSNLLLESRVFVRVLASRWSPSDAIARTEGMATGTDREWRVMVGLGAAFGGGQPGYVERFRARPLDSMLEPR